MKAILKSSLALTLCIGSMSAMAGEHTPELNSKVNLHHVTRDVGSGVHVGLDWSVSDYVRLFGSVESLQSDDRRLVSDIVRENPSQLEDLPDEYDPQSLRPSYTLAEAGLGLKKEVNQLLDFPFEVFVNASYVQLSYDDVKFADGKSTGTDGDTSTGDTSGDTSSGEQDKTYVISFPDYKAVKGAVGFTAYLTDKIDLSVDYHQYVVVGEFEDTKSDESGIGASLSYYPFKHFGIGIQFDSNDFTGNSAFGIGASFRW